MEKWSDRHIRDLVAHTAFQGLDANEIGCARISMMAGSKTLPSKGRIQMSQTNYLHIVIFGLQRTAGPYRCARRRHFAVQVLAPFLKGLDSGARRQLTSRAAY